MEECFTFCKKKMAAVHFDTFYILISFIFVVRLHLARVVNFLDQIEMKKTHQFVNCNVNISINLQSLMRFVHVFIFS